MDACVFLRFLKNISRFITKKRKKEKMFGCLLLTTVCYACKILNCDDV
jgi:hypothetical protein